MKFTKKPVVIEAVQWTGENLRECLDFLGDSSAGTSGKGKCESIGVATLEGCLDAVVGDWIVKDAEGQFYPRKPDVFQATHDAIEEETTA